MPSIVELVSAFKEKIRFSELKSTQEKFTEEQWITIVKVVLRYRNILEGLVNLSPQEIRLIGIVNGELNQGKEASKIKPNAETFLQSIGNEQRNEMRAKFNEFFDIKSEVFQQGLGELCQMMQNAQLLKAQGRTPKDGEELSDESIWGYTQITNEIAQLYFLMAHFIERILTQCFRDQLEIELAHHKDYLINAIDDLIALKVARGESGIGFNIIVKLWQTPKPDGLGWLSERRIEEYKKVLRSEYERKEKFVGQTRRVVTHDLVSLRRILEQWVRDGDTGYLIPEEVDEDLERLRGSIAGKNGYTYRIAEANGGVAGMMGFRQPEDRMMQYATTRKPAELVNAFVDWFERGRGVGKALFESVKTEAKKVGYTELIWNSGPRYKDSSWKFYDSLVGVEKVTEVPNYYGISDPTGIWRIKL